MQQFQNGWPSRSVDVNLIFCALPPIILSALFLLFYFYFFFSPPSFKLFINLFSFKENWDINIFLFFPLSVSRLVFSKTRETLVEIYNERKFFDKIAYVVKFYVEHRR